MSHAWPASPAAHCHESSDLTIPMSFYFHWHGCYAAGRSKHTTRRWAPGSRGHSDSEEALGISSGYKQWYSVRLADTREPSEAVPCEPCKIVRGGVWGYIIPARRPALSGFNPLWMGDRHPSWVGIVQKSSEILLAFDFLSLPLPTSSPTPFALNQSLCPCLSARGSVIPLTDYLGAWRLELGGMGAKAGRLYRLHIDVPETPYQ